MLSLLLLSCIILFTSWHKYIVASVKYSIVIAQIGSRYYKLYFLDYKEHLQGPPKL